MKPTDILQRAIKTDIFTEWSARPNFLILIPSRTPDKVSGLYIPESITKKTTQGICVKSGSDIDTDLFLGKECFFPMNTQYGVKDTVTGYDLYILNSEQVIMVREPDKATIEASIALSEAALKFNTIEQTQAVS